MQQKVCLVRGMKIDKKIQDALNAYNKDGWECTHSTFIHAVGVALFFRKS